MNEILKEAARRLVWAFASASLMLLIGACGALVIYIAALVAHLGWKAA